MACPRSLSAALAHQSSLARQDLCCWLAQSAERSAGAQELFGAFACGGSLVIAAPGGQRDTLYLARLCRQQRVTFAVFVPSQLDGLLQVRSPPTMLPAQCAGGLLGAVWPGAHSCAYARPSWRFLGVGAACRPHSSVCCMS